jgi:hypothetical protein
VGQQQGIICKFITKAGSQALPRTARSFYAFKQDPKNIYVHTMDWEAVVLAALNFFFFLVHKLGISFLCPEREGSVLPSNCDSLRGPYLPILNSCLSLNSKKELAKLGVMCTLVISVFRSLRQEHLETRSSYLGRSCLKTNKQRIWSARHLWAEDSRKWARYFLSFSGHFGKGNWEKDGEKNHAFSHSSDRYSRTIFQKSLKVAVILSVGFVHISFWPNLRMQMSFTLVWRDTSM